MTMPSAKREMVIIRPPMLLSWSSNVSHMVLSRKMLKRVSECRHLSDSDCSPVPVSCAAIEQDCTLDLIIQIFNYSSDDLIDVVFPHNYP